MSTKSGVPIGGIGATDTQTMLSSLLEDESTCDVTFRVGVAEDIKDIKAHRCVLAARSPVFRAMFYGELHESRAIIEVTDVLPDIFKLMKRFVYKDCTADINASNVIDLYYAADKYDIARLREICADKVKDFISMEKIGDFLEMMDVYDDEVVKKNCNAFVVQNAWKLFQKEEYFVGLSLKHLMYVWRHDTGPEGRNKLAEVDIYNGALKWAKTECARRRFPNNGPQSQRRALEDAMDLFSFPRMSLDEFHEVVRKSGLYTSDEITDMTLYLANGSKYNNKPPFGRPAPPIAAASPTASVRIRLPDGRLVSVQLDLLQAAIDGKPSTCGCDCKAKSKKRCDWQKRQIEVANLHSCEAYHKGKRYHGYEEVKDGLDPKLQ